MAAAAEAPESLEFSEDLDSWSAVLRHREVGFFDGMLTPSEALKSLSQGIAAMVESSGIGP